MPTDVLWVPNTNGNGHKRLSEADIEKGRREVGQLRETLNLTVEQYREAIAELEIAIEDYGWTRMDAAGDYEFSRGGLDRIIRLARLMFLKNPLIRRAIMVQSYYVFGQGVQIQARDEVVNEVVQGFLDDRKNRAVLSSHAAQEANEQALQSDGNLFFALFTNTDGSVSIRLLNVEEMRDVIANPDDREDRWFYHRVWQRPGDVLKRGVNASMQREERYYPDWQAWRDGVLDDAGNRVPIPSEIASVKVERDTPVIHVKVGGLRHMKFGVPDVYAALDWARAYKSFLENASSLMDSLSRFAFQLTTKGSKVGAAAKKLRTTLEPDSDESNPAPVTGGVFTSDEDTKLTAIPKSGATISPDDGKQLRTMVAAATDIPDTILSGDPDMGNLATAKTLDRPTELAMRSRQMLWQDVFRDICCFVVEAALKAGKLPAVADSSVPGGVAIGNDTDGNEIDVTVDVQFPSILEQDRESVVDSIVSAITLNGHPAQGIIDTKLAARLLLVALEQEDVDEIIEEQFPDDETPDEQATTERAEFIATLRQVREAVAKLAAPEPVGASA